VTLARIVARVTPYLLGLLERARGRDEQARAAFQHVLLRPGHYPDTPTLRDYQREYNTRIVIAPVPPLDLANGREGARPDRKP
jgi:hypothetical protein